MRFTHLHCHTHYSLLDGASKIPDLIEHVKKAGMDSIAMTDHGSMAGAVEFLTEAKAAGVKPVLGIEAYVAPGSRFARKEVKSETGETSFHLTLLAKTGEGARNLFRLSSLAYLEGFYYKPRIDHELIERYSEGVICLSGCVGSELAEAVLHGNEIRAKALASWYHKIFGKNFYIEVQNNGAKIQDDYARPLLDMAKGMGLPVVATSDAHYVRRSDSFSHELLLCINTRKKLSDPNRMRFESRQYHVRTPAEMAAAMAEFGDGSDSWVKRAAEIADGVEEYYPSLGLGRRQFPAFETPKGEGADACLRRLCREGVAERYGDDPGPGIAERLEYELEIICRMGFSTYFLVLGDIVRHAREAGIPVSARGSACGAIVSYLLRISNFCPLEHGLLFERFLDPSRSDPPDIDIDICKDRRHEVIAYVTAKYGADCVAQISTYNALGAKAALKDVGKALGFAFDDINKLNENVPTKLGTTLEGTYKEVEGFRVALEAEPRLRSVYEAALTLEGTVKSAGVHAAGVVITPVPVVELVPLRKDKDGIISTQWGMEDLEKAGLLKMDFLGLRNLTVLERVRREAGLGDLYALPKDDPDTFALLQRGESKGVFQLDGDGINDVLVRVRPDRIHDIAAILALYRPGPIEGGMIDDYVAVKHGKKKAKYLHPIMEAVLAPNHGVMVFQEDIMKILNQLGGLELTRAYACIKAISKKKPDAVAKFRAEFEAGARRHLSDKDASKVFELIQYFSGYGFNLSHATAYAYVAYQTAYVKVHYPDLFAAALLSSEMGGSERDKYLAGHVRDTKRRGVPVLPPDVNESAVDFRAEGGAVRYGLGAIKGLGEFAPPVVAARGDSPFADLNDLIDRVPLEKARLEKMIRAGALDGFGTRGALLAAVPALIRNDKNIRKDKKRGQRRLWDEPEVSASLPDVPDLGDAEKANDEMELLGVWVTCDPLDIYRKIFDRMSKVKIDGVRGPGPVSLGGVVTGGESRYIESGLMTRLLLEDDTGSISCVVWPNAQPNVQGLGVGWAGFLTGKIEKYKDNYQLIVSGAVPVSEAENAFASGVLIRPGSDPVVVERLMRVVRSHRGPCDVFFEVGGARVKADAKYRVRVSDGLRRDVESVVGVGSFLTLGARD